ncbi:esterase 1 [Mycena latifolia]|nr:esterase 1 [Mycena latifolia]
MLFSLFTLISLSAATPQVQLGSTTVIGRNISGLSLESFCGIPYAEAPTGTRRFNTTVLRMALPSEYDATNFGKYCLQPGMSPDLVSEDCLTVNVFRPAGLTSDVSLPVVSTLPYGGAFNGGSSGQYNASALVAQSVARGTPIIYVSFNYRLGPLGFPQGAEALRRGILNLGLRDQIACLEWVQLFIGAFGGDPSRVTLFGQSSGAIMTALLFLSDDISLLASAAIFESGFAATTAVFPADRGESDWQNFVGGVPSCSTTQNTSNSLDCLQGVDDPAEILAGCSAAAAQTDKLFPWTPTLDGVLVPDLPSRLFASGSFSRLPFIAGTNMDEGTIFTPNYAYDDMVINNFIMTNFSPPTTSSSDLKAAADTIVLNYPEDPAFGSPFNTGNETWGLSPQHKRAAAIEGDISFQSQRRLWAQTASAQGVKVFCYLFDQPQTPPPLGVYHGSEVRFVYGGVSPLAASDCELSRMMIDYWVSFATSLDPNDGLGVPRPVWTTYTPDNQNVMQLNGDNTTMIPDTYRQGTFNPPYTPCHDSQ